MHTRSMPAATSATSSACAWLLANGFSTSTCLPARNARMVQGACSELGSGM